jgi:hypothetical protein
MQKLLILLFYIVLFTACDRSTRVSGKITNVDTGEPMKDFYVTLGSGPGDSDVQTKTNIEGNYFLEAPKTKHCDMDLYAQRLDCARQNTIFFDGGGDHVFDFQFKYEGASLELKVVNTQNTPIKFYSRVRGQDINPETDHSLYSEPYPLVVEPFDSIIYVYSFPSGGISLNYDLVDIKNVTVTNTKKFSFLKNTIQQHEIRY